MEELRPVGAEFWHDYPPNIGSTDSRATRIKYRVVEHVRVVRFTGDTMGKLAEKWGPLAVEHVVAAI